MARIKIGGIYLLDPAGVSGLKDYGPVKVQVVQRDNIFNGTYICRTVSPVLTLTFKDSYALKFFSVHKSYLTPTTIDEKVVVRSPMNMPTFNENDIDCINSLIVRLSQQNYDEHTLNRLKAILVKMQYALQFNEVGS